jgi:hypothetical protein
MAIFDENILENLTNRNLGSSPVGFRQLQAQNFPTLRNALDQSANTRANELKKRLADFQSKFTKKTFSRGFENVKPVLPDFNKVTAFGYNRGSAGVDPTVQLAKLNPLGGYSTINADIGTARNKFGIGDIFENLPDLGQVNGLNANALSNFITDNQNTGKNTLGLRDLLQQLTQGQI